MLYIFDFDGTLIDTSRGITKSAQVTLVQMGYPEYPLEHFMTFMGPPLNYSFCTFAGMSEEEAAEAVTIFRRRYSDVGKFESDVYPGMIALLEDLKRAGYDICVASAKPEQYVREILDHFGMIAYFDCIVGSTMDEKLADKERNIRRALELTGYAEHRDDAWMIGDRMYDIDGARKAGIKSVGVLYGGGTREELESAGADRLAETVEDLGEILLQA